MMTTDAVHIAPSHFATRARTATDLRMGGGLLFLAGATILMGIITAEALYPGTFSTGANEISDLGGTRPPNSVIHQPSATLFNLSMLFVGIAVMASAWFIHRAFGRRSVTIPVALLGIGALGVGLFPGNTGAPHALFSMVTFFAGGITAIAAARVANGPFRYLSGALGVVALVALASTFLGEDSPLGPLGIGGIERWIAYPVVLWLTAFGGYLSGRGESVKDEAGEGRG
ncbi:MAG: DUF998 domain-containing protein [Chloroflexota bacterium]